MFAAHAPWWSYFTSSCSGTCSSGEVHRGVELLGIAKASSAPADENITTAPVVSCVATAPAGYAVPSSVLLQPCATSAPVAEQRVSVRSRVHFSSFSRDRGVSTGGRVRRASVSCAQQPRHVYTAPLPAAFVAPQRQRQRRSPAPALTGTPASTWRQLRPCAQRRHQWRRHRAETSDVAASNSQTTVAAAVTLRRHIRILLLRQQGRCGVTFAYCCCGSKDVAASHSQTAVAAAETLQLPEFSAEQRWNQCCPSIDCESSFSGQRLSKCLWSGIPQIQRWCQIIKICCDV